ncbi:MAG: hypothetical protein HQK53_10040, partial [Oligoflexia bacterium]|nr:hypothetical protein [Oligoflexia bacterium]
MKITEKFAVQIFKYQNIIYITIATIWLLQAFATPLPKLFWPFDYAHTDGDVLNILNLLERGMPIYS